MSSLITLVGCLQDVGQTCQIDSDCSTGLKCDALASGTERGVCYDPKAPMLDSGSSKPTDSGQPDLPDANTSDASASDASAATGDGG